MSIKDDLVQRAREYCQRHGLTLGDELGFGVHGTVFVTESQPKKKGDPPSKSAIKIFLREADYRRERDVYLRLQENKVSEIAACNVPELVRFEDTQWVIEMTVVTRPFVLDFAGAFLDQAPDFSDEVLADWRAEKLEQFGAKWPKVETILRILETYGIHVIDVTPNNVALAESE